MIIEFQLFMAASLLIVLIMVYLIYKQHNREMWFGFILAVLSLFIYGNLYLTVPYYINPISVSAVLWGLYLLDLLFKRSKY